MKRASLALGLVLALATPVSPERVDTWLEKVLGPLVSGAVASGTGTDEDPLLADWVRRIGAKVAAQSPRDDLKPRFTILASDVANALALPGGQVFVTRGLLDTVTSDDELAGVLAHETGHVARRHATKQLGENAAAIALIGMLGGGKAGRVGGTLLNALRGLGRSRQLEAQADAVGLQIAAGAGYDPRGLTKFLEGFSGAKQSKLEEYFATHPTPEKRLAACWKSPLVICASPADRASLAASFEARGLSRSARKVREGRDPLALPPLNSPITRGRAERVALGKKASESLNALTATWKTQRAGATLQQLMLLNSQASDVRWLVLAARAYGVQSRLQDSYARTVRTLQVAPANWDALPDGEEGALGRAEMEAAVMLAGEAREPLKRAATATAGVLLDLNNRFWRPKGREAWLRYAGLETALQYAESELSRADDRSGRAWRQLSLARIRRYEARLSALAPPGDPARRELAEELLRVRLGVLAIDARPGEPFGACATRLALAVETGKSPVELDALQSEAGSWAEATRKVGIPENVATFLRSLSFDLERETP